MLSDVKNSINDLQLTILQDFFELRMREYAGDSWKQEVKQVVTKRSLANDQYSPTYRSVYDVIEEKGIETINKRSFDITLVTAFLLFDFYDKCKVGTAFKKQIKCIREDKNGFISHNSDMGDRLTNSIMALSCLKNLKIFVEYLEQADWSGSDKDLFVETYKDKVNRVIQEFYANIEERELEAIEIKSDVDVYLKGILQEQEEHAEQYIPLSYKRLDNLNDQYDLEEINKQNERGFVLFAEAGYGKTWSLLKLASSYADDYLNAKSDVIPIFIKMGQVASDSRQIIMEYIREKLFCNKIQNDDVISFLRKNKIVLFIDGFDEAISSVKEAVKAEMAGLFSDYKQIAIIGGTREADRFKFPEKLVQYHICDLSESQLEQFVEKFVEPQYREKVKRLLLNPDSYFSKIRTPFYITCYANIVNEGVVSPSSITEIVSICLDKMIEREIRIKGFHCTEAYMNEFLFALGSALGEKSSMLESEALRMIESQTKNTIPEGTSISAVEDRLIEMHVIKAYMAGRKKYLAFHSVHYRMLFSETGNDDALLDF
ncbi:MAG: NACHT domain-containing protein [Lachnospiraceae bacterium]|nr:NACHT domain-containing protein [Lachnospiraceae bacterium]